MIWASIYEFGFPQWYLWIAFAIGCATIFVWNVVMGIWIRLKKRGHNRDVLQIRIGGRTMTFDPDHPSRMFDERLVEPVSKADENGPSES